MLYQVWIRFFGSDLLVQTFLIPDAETCFRLKAQAASVTRVTVASEDMAVPRDSEEYKQLYDNIGVVGSGTFGSVYCAIDKETEEYVAAKYMILQIEKVRSWMSSSALWDITCLKK